MLVLLPVVLLSLTLFSLVAVQRWRPAFKSYWFVATGGVLLASLVTLGLRVGLPHQITLPGWQLGPDVQFPFLLALDAFSWPLAVSVLIVLLAHLLGRVRRASGISWPIWVPALALAAAALLVALAGDLLAAALTLFLLDILQYGLHSALALEQGRASLLERLAFNTSSVILVLAAWAIPASYASLASLVLGVAATMRLAVAIRPLPATRQDMPAFHAMLHAAPLVGAVVLLRFMPAVSGPALQLALAVVFGLGLYSAGQNLEPAAPRHWQQASLAALVLIAGLAGAQAAVLAFGLLWLFSDSVAQLTAQFGEWHRPLTVVAALLLAGLLFTSVQGVSTLYPAAASPLVFLALPLHTLLLLGLLQRAAEPAAAPDPDEPWTLAVEAIAASLPAVMLLLLGVLMPAPSGLAWWPGLVVLLLLAAAYAGRQALQRSGRRLLPPHLRLPQIQWPAPRRAAALLSAALAGSLRLLSSLLEGEAGLLWALLFIALLISVFSQTGLG